MFDSMIGTETPVGVSAYNYRWYHWGPLYYVVRYIPFFVY